MQVRMPGPSVSENMAVHRMLLSMGILILHFREFISSKLFFLSRLEFHVGQSKPGGLTFVVAKSWSVTSFLKQLQSLSNRVDIVNCLCSRFSLTSLVWL